MKVFLAQNIPNWSNITPGDSNPPPATIQDLEVVFARIVAVAVALAGLALLTMFVIGSLKLLTSAGEPKAVESAKNTMTYAVIGMVLIVGSYLVLRLLETFTGLPLTIFSIPKP